MMVAWVVELKNRARVLWYLVSCMGWRVFSDSPSSWYRH